MRTTTLTVALYLLALSVGAVGCSSKSSNNPGTSDSGTSEAGDEDSGSPAGTIKDNGNVTTYDDNGKTPIKNAPLVEGDATGTTDDKGNFTLTIPAEQPYSLVIKPPPGTSTQYVTTYMPEIIAHGDNNRPKIMVPSVDTFHLAQGALPGFDTSKGVIYVVVYATGSCASIAGGTVSVVSPADAKLVYFDGALTSTAATKFADDHIPGAALYNVTPGADVKIEITHPTCKMREFPAAHENVTYTGKVEVHPASEEANSALVVFLE